MTSEQKIQIKELRQKGVGYTRISKVLGISVNTVRSHCRRNGLMEEDITVKRSPASVDPKLHFCKYCGVLVEQNPGRKEKLFCSDKCRMKWWNSHPEKVDRKAMYEFTCEHCGKPFTAYGNANRKYCCTSCFRASRKRGGTDGE